MPELPEVETIRRSLQRAIVGKRVRMVASSWPKQVSPKPVALNRKIAGQSIVSTHRWAKILGLRMSGGSYLQFHLKLTGQLIYKLKTKNSKLVFGGHPQPGGLDDLPNTFTRHIFSFTDGSRLYFNDLRKFGWVKLVSAEAVTTIAQALGVDPLSRGFTSTEFSGLLTRHPKWNIKQLLMDQTLIAGIGNIYADETLFAAKILPGRIVKTLSPREARLLHRTIPVLLRKAVKYRGTSTDAAYRQIDGAPGGYAPFLKVYGRAKLLCKRCKTPITKTRLNGRGTHYCSSCQG